ncbi:MAG TPA: SulP family inorganic anion transporter [Gammaproteobacteria bacterium]|nr:SulP family inorganic anion transporter [Gammaproteobacteria bacterium]
MTAPLSIPRLTFENLRGDFYGGVTAAVVALPLALAFGVASGAGPVAGIYGAVFVGFFAAVFGGTPSQVSGPTGPMTVVMAAIITRYSHEPAMAFTVVMMAGLIQMGFGFARLGRFISLMPYPVISGFMSGIGVIIIILQLSPLAGHANPQGGPLNAVAALPQSFGAPLYDALIVGLIALSIAFFLPPRIARLIPPPLVALVVGTLAVMLFFSRAPVLGEIPTGIPDPQLPRFELAALPAMIKSALVLAFLGSIDSLLTSLIADNITHSRHDSDRELVGQGIGNFIAGLMGAIPGSGATMRTVVNVRSGGRTPISGALHAVVLLAVMLGLGRYAALIPHAVLAGILIKVGIDIIDWDYLKRLRTAPRAGVTFMFVVLFLTVFVDLVTAVAVGVVLASLLFVKRMSDLQIASVRAIVEPEDDPSFTAEELEAFERAEGKVLYVHLGGPLSFGAANEVGRRLGLAAGFDVLVLDLSATPFMDSSASLAIEGVIRHAASRHQPVLLVGMVPAVERVLAQLEVLRLVPDERRFESRLEAFRQAARQVRPGTGESG